MTNQAIPVTAAQEALQTRLVEGLDALALDRDLAAPLLGYLDLLVRWNQTYNLTAVRDPLEMVDKHLLDSLAMHSYLDDVAAAGGSLADLGTGAGLPGIPLAIAKTRLRVTLVESNGKKCRFMREVVRKLDLENVQVIESRIEALDRPGAGGFDAITARALATLPLIVQLGGHLLGPNGRLLAMKGVYPAQEIAQLPPGWTLSASHPLQVPGLDAARHLLIVGRSDVLGRQPPRRA